MRQEAVSLIDGRLVEETKASIPLSDRGFLFGDGVFTTLKVLDGNIQWLEEHLERIRQSCEELNISAPAVAPDQLAELISRNNAAKGCWRMKIIVTGGDSTQLTLARREGRVIVTLRQEATPPREQVRLTVYPYPIQRPVSRIKSLSYLDRLYVKQHAINTEYDDACVVSSEGYLLETAFSNLFWIHNKILYTPSSDLGLLKGVALQVIEREAVKLGWKVIEEKVSLNAIPDGATVFVCNAISGAVVVSCIDETSYCRDSLLELTVKKFL